MIPGSITHLFNIYSLLGTVINNKELSSLETEEKAEEGEDSDRKDEARESNTDKEWKSPSFKFDVDVLEEQRILESDELIRFDTSPVSDEMRETSSAATPSEGGFQYQNARRIRQKIKNIIRKELKKDDMMSEDEANQVCIGSVQMFLRIATREKGRRRILELRYYCIFTIVDELQAVS